MEEPVKPRQMHSWQNQWRCQSMKQEHYSESSAGIEEERESF